jgi:hypothetical protein
MQAMPDFPGSARALACRVRRLAERKMREENEEFAARAQQTARKARALPGVARPAHSTMLKPLIVPSK